MKWLFVFVSLLVMFFIALLFVKKKWVNKVEPSNWAQYVKKVGKTEGGFVAHDKHGLPVVLEWKKRDTISADLAEVMTSISDVSAQAFTSVEVNFLRAHPDVVHKDEQFEEFKPFFKDGSKHVDWKQVEKKMHSRIEQIFLGDFSALNPDWTFIFVIAKNKKTGQQLGAAQFFVMPGYARGDVKVTSIAVKPEAQVRGLGRLLMSSIFKIIPDIKRVFLATRITNSNAINAYKAWGFTVDTNPADDPFLKFKEHWINLEYKILGSDRLQKTAEQMVK